MGEFVFECWIVMGDGVVFEEFWFCFDFIVGFVNFD